VPLKVLVSDKLAPEGLAILNAAPELEITAQPGISAEKLLEIIGEFDGLIIRSGTTVTKAVLDRADNLKVIGRAGIGVDNIDVNAASERGVVVMNTPGGNNVTTAEHTISMLMAVARHIPQANASLREGKWLRGQFLGTEVSGKTLGIVGVGNIGSIVADRAKGLTMKVLAFDPFITPEAAARMGIELVSLEDLYRRSDFISVHTPLTPETRGLIGKSAFSRMKTGVRVINCARGGIIDEVALLAALESGKVAGAALDVFATEPPAADSPLLAHPMLVATPHLGASTGEAQLNVAIAVAEQVRDFLVTGEVRNAVNVPSMSQEVAGELAPYLLLAERIGSLHAQVAGRVPSEIKVEFRGGVASLDCRAVIPALLKGLLGRVLEVPVNAVNAPFLAKDRGVKVVELRDPGASNFASSIRVSFKNAEGSALIEGAVFGGDIVRLVRFNDFFLETVPEGDILLLHNRDVPGVVGRVGTFLAEHKVNIASFVLGRVGGEAVSFVHTDSPLQPEQLETLRGLSDITSAQMVRL
jgi:D-3-phosphoglycerate dehydrogenase